MMFPLHDDDRAHCVLGVPNHTLHCYPVSASVPSSSPEERKMQLRLMPHLRRKPSKRRIIAKLLCYLAMLLVVACTVQLSFKVTQYQIHLDYVPILPELDHSRAIFLISMGRQAAESKIVERFLMSTRRRGSWNGYIVLLTDAPDERYQYLEDKDEHFLVKHPRPEHFNWETKHDMPYKRFKTYVLDYVDAEPKLDNVELIYYLDVDIVVGNRLSSFFDDIESLYNVSSVSKGPETTPETTADKESRIYFFKGNFLKTPVQGGQIILERDSSRNCLLWWRSMMDTQTNETKDQPFLKHMQAHNTNDTFVNSFNCRMTVMEQEPHLHFPSADSISEMNNKWWTERNYATLLHIKNTGKVRKIDRVAETDYIRDVLNMYFWDSDQDVARKMHFDPDEPPWSPKNHTNISWMPTYDLSDGARASWLPADLDDLEPPAAVELPEEPDEDDATMLSFSNSDNDGKTKLRRAVWGG
jgi:hypothetical protein